MQLNPPSSRGFVKGARLMKTRFRGKYKQPGRATMNTTKKQSLNCFCSFITISGPFHSPSEVLFIFPSWYWFAIGLHEIFSFSRCLPTVRTAIPSNPTLTKRPITPTGRWLGQEFHFPCWAFPSTLTTTTHRTGFAGTRDTSPDKNVPGDLPLSFTRFARRY